ncbi:hypothetical protein FRC03_007060 [Tulasnella sp. 419]|nr:hypothetical protein FRC03_007060 [Tulasnella sp. 419]
MEIKLRIMGSTLTTADAVIRERYIERRGAVRSAASLPPLSISLSFSLSLPLSLLLLHIKNYLKNLSKKTKSLRAQNPKKKIQNNKTPSMFHSSFTSSSPSSLNTSFIPTHMIGRFLSPLVISARVDTDLSLTSR